MILVFIIFAIAVGGLLVSQLLLWKKITADGGSVMTWKDTNDVIGTWTSVIGTLAAIVFSGYSIHHANTLFHR
jgi:hypothetical protein